MGLKTSTISPFSLILGLLVGVGNAVVSNVNIAPHQIGQGIFWSHDGFHYLSKSQVEQRIAKINMPAELAMAKKISVVTPTCDATESGFCQ